MIGSTLWGIVLKKILLIQLRQLGDILLTTPCIREIKINDPDAHITFLSHPMGKHILNDNPYLDQLLLYNDKDPWYKELSFVKSLRKEKFDVVFDFMNNPRSAIYSLFSGSDTRVSFVSKRKFAYNKLVDREKVGDYLVREKFKLLREMGYEPKSERPILPWFEKDTTPLLDMVKENDSFAKAPIRVVLSPTHRRVMRRWPVENYAKLADFLVSKWGAEVVWIWGPSEKEFVSEVQSLCKEKTFMAPNTTFRELAAFIANCDLFVGNSNGPSHVAVAADTCSFQIHGPTQARSWCPSNEKHRAIQSKEIGFGQYESLEKVSFSEVWSKLQHMKPVIMKQAEKRRQNGVKSSWQ